MNNKIVCILIALIAVELVFGQPMTCGGNEVFKQCADKANHCEPSCAVPKPQICTEMCRPGCDCKEGFLRSKDVKCVLPKEC